MAENQKRECAWGYVMFGNWTIEKGKEPCYRDHYNFQSVVLQLQYDQQLWQFFPNTQQTMKIIQWSVDKVKQIHYHYWENFIQVLVLWEQERNPEVFLLWNIVEHILLVVVDVLEGTDQIYKQFNKRMRLLKCVSIQPREREVNLK